MVFGVSGCCFGIDVGRCSIEKKLVFGEGDEKGGILDDDVVWNSVSDNFDLVYEFDGG